MYAPRLVVHHAEAAVVERIDAVGYSAQDYAASVAQLERLRYLVLDIHHREAAVSRVVGYYAAADILRHDAFHQREATRIFGGVGCGVVEVFVVYGLHDGLFHRIAALHALQFGNGILHAPYVSVKALHGGVQDGAEHRVVDLLGYLVRHFEARYGCEVELERAGYVAGQGGGREHLRIVGVEESFELFERASPLIHRYGLRLADGHVDADVDASYVVRRFVSELVYVAALFARALFVGVRAVEHIDILGALY